MCDDTQNLNKIESESFFRYQIFPIPNPILFSIPNVFDTESDTFSIPNFSDTESDTSFDINFFDTASITIPKIGNISKPRSFETETSHSYYPLTAVEAGPALMNFFDGLFDNTWVGLEATKHLVDLLADLGYDLLSLAT